MRRIKADVRSTFVENFGKEPLIIRAPGRINIIGEHTDYNEGFVLPAAIDLSAYIFIQKNDSGKARLVSVDLEESYSFQISDPLAPVEIGWVNYFLGVIDQFRIAGYELAGFDLMFCSDIPMGAGLSSSAALECGFGKALNELFELKVDSITLAKMGQKAEHKFAGVQCGIMDQFASTMGQKDQVIKLDCQSLQYEFFPADFSSYELVLFDSNVKHRLADSQYNIRRSQCEEGVAAIQRIKPEVKSLRDVSLQDLKSTQTEMSATVYNRCLYVLEENQRVQSACVALRAGDIEELGHLMLSSHTGLRDLYEVSCKELDMLLEAAKECEGHVGGRMMGGGFGGCTINLIRKEKVEQVIDQVSDAYERGTGIQTKVYRVAIADGVGVYREEIGNEV